MSKEDKTMMDHILNNEFDKARHDIQRTTVDIVTRVINDLDLDGSGHGSEGDQDKE